MQSRVFGGLEVRKRLVVMIAAVGGRFCLIGLIFYCPVGFAGAAENTSLEQREQIIELFSSSPAYFIENTGQLNNSTVRYAFYGSGANIYHTANGPVFQLFKKEKIEQAGPDKTKTAEFLKNLPHNEIKDREDFKTTSYTFSAHFVNAKEVRPIGADRQQTKVNYYLGGDPNKWRQNVTTFTEVVYPALYEGIDLHTFGKRSHLKYEFHIAPGADYEQIIVRYEGIEELSIDSEGRLHIQTPMGELIDDAPVIWQEIGGQKVEIAGRYHLIDKTSYAFKITSQIDPMAELIIDPEISWVNYLGESNNGFFAVGCGIAVDSAGNALLTGYTTSANFPTPGGFDTSHNGGYDAFVAKVSNSGQLVWASFLGGSGYDRGSGIAVDSAGNMLLTGWTSSSDFPTPGGFDTSYNGGTFDVFVAKITHSGQLIWASFLGGSSGDFGYGIAVDSAGNALLTGTTASANFPTPGGFDTSLNGYVDAFVAKVTNSGQLIWASFLGGCCYNDGRGIATDSAGNALLTGFTSSADFPTPGGFDMSLGGDYDAYVAKVTNSGQLVWASFLGGGGIDHGYGIAVDSAGNAFLTGDTYSTDFPTPGGFDTSHNGGDDVFVAKVSNSGQLVWSSFLGGSGDDRGSDIAVDSAGNVFLTGGSSSSYGFPTPGGFEHYGGLWSGFAAKVANSSQLIWSSFLGICCPFFLDSCGIAVDSVGDVLLTGDAYFLWNDNLNRDEAFVAKISSVYDLVLETSPNGSWIQNCGGQIIARVNQDAQAQTGWTVTGTITDPDETEYPLDFSLQVNNYVTSYIPDIVGTWTINATATKGEEQLTAAAPLQVDEGSVFVAIRNNAGQAAHDFTENEFVYITVSNGTSKAIKFTVSALAKNTSTADEVKQFEYESPEINGTKTFAIPALPVFHYSNPNRYAYHIVDVLVGGNIASSTIFEGQRNDFVVMHSSGVKPDMILLTEPERLRSCFWSEDWWNESRSKSQYPPILGLIHKMCQDRGILVYSDIVHLGGTEYTLKKELSQIADRLRRDNTPIGFLCLLGGTEVLPTFPSVGVWDVGVSEGDGDWGYWCNNTWFGSGAEDVTAVFYSRIPSFDPTDRTDIGRKRNYWMYYNAVHCRLLDGKERSLAKSLVLGGRDLKSCSDDGCFLDVIRKATQLPVPGKMVSHVFEKNLTPPFLFPESYDKAFLQSVDLLVAHGHANQQEIVSGVPDEYSECIRSLVRESDVDRGALLFTNDGQYGPGLPNSTIEINAGDKLNDPVVLLGGCNVAQGLAQSFMLDGAIGCAGNAAYAEISASRYFLMSYIDAIQQGGCIGGLFYEANHDGWGTFNGWGSWGSLNIFNKARQDAEFTFKNYLQFGYPKQMVAIGNTKQAAVSTAQTMRLTSDIITLVTNLTVNIQDYNYDTDPYGTTNDVVSYTAIANGEIVNSSQWDLAANPLLPYQVHVFSLPSDITVSQVVVTSDVTNLGAHIIAESPERWNASGIHEYWPLDYSTYMPDIVQWHVWKNPDGDRKLGLAIFPFQYTPATSNLVMHDQINISISYTNITASIQSASFADEEALKGNPAVLSVVAIGDCNLIVTVDGNEVTQQSQISDTNNVFLIATTNLSTGPHTAQICCEVNEALNDESSISFSVYDSRFEFNGVFAQSAVQQGAPLRVSWSLTNIGLSPEMADLSLECHNGNQFFNNDANSLTLDPCQTNIMATYLPTESLIPGLASIQVKADVNGETFYSPEIHTVVTILDTDSDGMSDIWEQQIIDANLIDEITNILQVLPEDDFDHDGFTNSEEYMAGTDPTDPVDHPIPGDFDDNGKEDLIDFAIFASAWMSELGQANWNPACDISSPKDDIIDCSDLAVFVEYWLGGIEYSPPIVYVGDFDENGKEDLMDFAILASAWMSQPGQADWNAACDISVPKDNIINLSDWCVFAGDWLAGVK